VSAERGTTAVGDRDLAWRSSPLLSWPTQPSPNERAPRPGVRGALTIARPQGIRAGASRHRQWGEWPMAPISYQSQRWAGVPQETACSPLSVASPKLVKSVPARSAAWAMHEGEMHAGICGAQEIVGRRSAHAHLPCPATPRELPLMRRRRGSRASTQGCPRLASAPGGDDQSREANP
jgi:hypothetical protein